MPSRLFPAVVLAALLPTAPSSAQFHTLETEDLRLVYLGAASDYLVGHVARSYTNSLGVYKRMFSFEPSEPVTVYLHDASDYGNAGADVLPTNFIGVSMAPLQYSFETSPANERINSTMHHELIHIVANDQAAGRDRVFRALFGGKVAVDRQDPLTVLYSYATAPRRYAPRWYQEGLAVFMETWMSGALGRTMGGYDEMVFRTKVLDGGRFYDMIGLESEGTSVDFQLGVNSYLYGTRFMSYLALTYGPRKVLDWMERPAGSKAHFTAQFAAVFGEEISQAWKDWVAFERVFQARNLERIRERPVTAYRSLAARSLGSISRAYVDTTTNELITAANYPGTLPHIAAINLDTGAIRRLAYVSGPMLYTVTSLAFDPGHRRVFYTTDNSRWRALRVLDLATGRDRELIEHARAGDLAFNRADGSVWGVRHDLGLSTIVRIPAPYDRWEQVCTLEYGTDVYDLDISPDGRWMTAAKVEVDGGQSLVRMPTQRCPGGGPAFEELVDFGTANPESFVFSDDGTTLYGSSYYNGVSNLYRYEITADRLVAVTNAESGFFRPQPAGADSLVAFRFTDRGFTPVMLADRPVEASAISFLGQEIVERYPVVTTWVAPPPSRVDLEEVGANDRPYHGLRAMRPETVIPVVLGYRDDVAYGLRLDLADPVGMHSLSLTAAYSPTVEARKERIHAGLRYQHYGWSLSAHYNRADFYDLFGPRQVSRRGTQVMLAHTWRLLYHTASRNLSLQAGADAHFDLDRIAENQNVTTGDRTNSYGASLSLDYVDVRSSLGAVESESGVRWSLSGSATASGGDIVPRTWGTLDVGTLLPVPHLTVWAHLAAGASAGDVDNPYAHFYFSGFQNNWVDYRPEKRYRSIFAFPGLRVDQSNYASGRNFAKGQVEAVLPPLRFRDVGGTFLFVKWLRTSLFATTVATDLDADSPPVAYNAGGQIDVRLVLFSYLNTTLSFGAARAWKDRDSFMEYLVSLKLL
jgi:hypothetical protein